MFWTSKPKHISIVNLNDGYVQTINEMKVALGGKTEKFYRKRYPKKIFVLDFDGDVMASRAHALSQEITTIIYNARQGDQVLVRLTSPGGAAHAYGYAASQLERLKKAKIPLIISVDKVAASGGYMMACVADKLISAPYAIIGSIGVVAEFPNFNKFLKNLGVEYKQYTAGKFKRTISTLGPVTEQGEKKFQENLDEVHQLFQNHVIKHRPNLNLDKVATGEHWHGLTAIGYGLVDEIKTSEEFLVEQLDSAELLKVTYVGGQKSLAEKLGESFALFLGESFFNALAKALMNFLLHQKLMQ